MDPMSAHHLLKVSGTAAVAAGGLSLWDMVNRVTITMFDVPLAVFFMAGLGALLSFAYSPEGEKPVSKKRMYTLVTVNTIMAAAIVSVFPEWLGWSWFNAKIEGSVALLVAVVMRFTFQLLVDTVPSLIPELLRKWFKLHPKTEEDQK